MASGGGIKPCKKLSKYRNNVVCLLCSDQKRRPGCSLGHIESHLSFKKYMCTKCAYKAATEETSMVHTWKTGHQMKCSKNEYMELLASKIYMDCLRATDLGIERVLDELRAQGVNRPRKGESSKKSRTVLNEEQHLQQNATEDTFEINSETNPTMLENRDEDNFEQVENEAENENQWNAHSNVDDSVQKNSKRVQKACSHKIKVSQKKRRTNSDSQITTSSSTTPCADVTSSSDAVKCKKKKRTSTSLETESRNETATSEIQVSEEVSSKNVDKTASSIEEASQSDAQQFDSAVKSKQFDKVVCQKCGKKIRSSYVRRRRHVMRYHHNNDVDETDFDDVLSCEVRCCFPACIISGDLQCNECGKQYKSESGRKFHVIRDHMKRMMKCVIHGCTIQNNCPAALKLHIQNDHKMVISTEINADIFRVFLCAKKKFDAALAVEVIRYFPIDLKSRTVNSAVPSTVNKCKTPTRNDETIEAEATPSQENTTSSRTPTQSPSTSGCLKSKLEIAQSQTRAQLLQMNQHASSASPKTDRSNQSNLTMQPTRHRTLLPTPPTPPVNNGYNSAPYSSASSTYNTDQQVHRYDSSNTDATSNNHSTKYSNGWHHHRQHTPYQTSPSFRNAISGDQQTDQQQQQQEQHNQYDNGGYARYQHDRRSGPSDTDNKEWYVYRTPESQKTKSPESVQPSHHTEVHSDSTTKRHQSEKNHRHVHTSHSHKSNVLASKRGINRGISHHKSHLRSTQPTKRNNQQFEWKVQYDDPSSSSHQPGTTANHPYVSIIKTELNESISVASSVPMQVATKWSGKRIRLDQSEQSSPTDDANSINMSTLQRIGQRIGLMKKELQDNVP